MTAVVKSFFLLFACAAVPKNKTKLADKSVEVYSSVYENVTMT